MDKIHVFVRHCFYSSNSNNKPRPANFSREICHKNLKRTGGDDVNIMYMLDTASRKGQQHFLETLGEPNIVCMDGGNDAISFLNVVNYVEKLSLKDDDIIYFCEDDYFHVDGWTHILREGFTLNPDWVTLYDHHDKYGILPMYHKLRSQIFVTEHTHWRVVPNTTNTYACKYKTFIKYIDIQKKYCDLVEKWTKDSYKFAELESIGSTLISTIPGWSTHMEPPYMSPVVDWDSLVEMELSL